MQWIKTNIRRYLDQLRTPGFTAGAATTILAALLWELVSQAVQSSLNHQNVGFYLMAVIALVCLILVTNFLKRIEKLVESRNYTQFITSKPVRLNKMTECIKNAKRSIYILSDLSGTDETQMEEHAKYIEALNQVIENNKGNRNFDVKRIVVPPYASGMNAKTDTDWIYKIPVTKAYLKHFSQLRDCKPPSPKYNNGPCNVSMILIDNKYLFWKPEITHSDAYLDTLLDGGLYLEDYTHEGIADFAERFRDMFDWAQPINLAQFGPYPPKKT
jgi:hypothetical protein